MNCEEALKRLKQETCPCTYNPDFDKDECLEVIKKTLEDQRDELINLRKEKQFYRNTGIEKSQEFKELVEFVNFIVVNSIIHTDKIGYKLELKWISLNAYVPKDKRDLFDKVVEKYGK